MLTCLFTDLEGTIWQQVNLRHWAKLHWHDFKRISYLGLLFWLFVFAGKNPVLVFLVFCAIYLLDLQHTTCSIKRMLSLIVFCNKSDKSLTRSADEVARNIWKGQIYLLIWAPPPLWSQCLFWIHLSHVLLSFESVTFIQPRVFYRQFIYDKDFIFILFYRQFILDKEFTFIFTVVHGDVVGECPPRWIYPEKADPDPVPFPCLIFLSISLFSHPSLTLIWKALVLTSSASDHNMSQIFWLPCLLILMYIHLSLSFVRLCSSVSASTVSNCLPVSVRCFSVWIHCLFLLWENSPYLTLQNTDATKHYQFTPRQSQWDFAFVAPPESSCILGRLRCSRLQ